MPALRDIFARSGAPPTERRDPDTVKSLLSQIGSTGFGAVATVGNFLDTPGASVRALLVGQNPFTPWWSPLSGEGRVYGRDVLEHYGMRPNKETGMSGWLADPMEGLRDLAGFGVEVLTDPFGPIGGAAARATGLTAAMTRTAAARAAARAASTPGVLRRLPKMPEAGQTLHPVVYGLGVAAKAAFDPLSATGRSALTRAFRGVKTGAKAVFDKYAWGLTDPVLQATSAAVREAARATADQTQCNSRRSIFDRGTI